MTKEVHVLTFFLGYLKTVFPQCCLAAVSKVCNGRALAHSLS